MSKAFLSTQKYTDPEIRARLSAPTQEAIEKRFKFTYL